MISSNSSAQERSVSFGARLVASSAFSELFRDGMALVEETAAYLDGPGRDAARHLPRTAALAYAAESMRLTTCLMQVAAWLLLQRAVNEGEMTQAEAAGDKRRSRGAWQTTNRGSADDLALPDGLSALIAKSMRLQTRIERLDAALDAPDLGRATHPLEAERARLLAAFAAEPQGGERMEPATVGEDGVIPAERPH